MIINNASLKNILDSVIAASKEIFGAHLESVVLYGSYARGEADENSDIDLCIEAVAIKGLFALGGLYADLEEALGKELDLITAKSLKYNDDDSFKNNLEKERVLIYEAA